MLNGGSADAVVESADGTVLYSAGNERFNDEISHTHKHTHTHTHTHTVWHYGIFPKSLSEVVAHYRVQELHLTLTQGQWRTRVWGYPTHPAPPGAELWAWFCLKQSEIAKFC